VRGRAPYSSGIVVAAFGERSGVLVCTRPSLASGASKYK
jgi:hypothetical protein